MPLLRKEKLTEEDMKETLRNLKKQGIMEALATSGQDPDEVGEISKNAMKVALQIIEKRFLNHVDNMLVLQKKELAKM